MSTLLSNQKDAKWAIARHIIPFLIWIGIMSIPMSNTALRYALQGGASLVALLALKPWQYYSIPNLRSFPLSLAVGFGVAGFWILPETQWILQFKGVNEFYVRYFIRGSSAGNGYLYAPEHCGWLLSLVKFSSSAFVIAVIEEFFWRGFLMRWLVKIDFWEVDAKKVGWALVFLSALLFGFEHSRWLVGVMAGLAYGWLYRRNGDIAGVASAHVTTNFLLGLYVLATGSYQFW